MLDALFQGAEKIEREKQEIELDARFTVSDREVLEKKDFAQMTRGRDRGRQGRDQAPGAGASTTCKTRRLAPHPHGHRIDLRRTLRASMKAGGALIDLKYRGPKTKMPPIVALLDISGSMSQYTRLFLHFLHAVTDARKRVSHLPVRHAADQRDARAEGDAIPDEALAACSASVLDWSGGTRIATSLARVQQAMVAPGADPGRGRAAVHRRAGARSRRAAGLRDRPAAPLLPAADLAQSAAAFSTASRPRRAASR